MEEGLSSLTLLDEASNLGLFSMRIGFVNDVGIEAPLAKDDDEIPGLLIEEDDDIRSDEATLASSSDSSNSEDSRDGDRALRNDFLYTILTSERHPTLTRDFLIFQLVRLLPFSWDESYDISEIDTYDLNRFMIVEYIDDWLIADRRTDMVCTLALDDVRHPDFILSNWLEDNLNPTRDWTLGSTS